MQEDLFMPLVALSETYSSIRAFIVLLTWVGASFAVTFAFLLPSQSHSTSYALPFWALLGNFEAGDVEQEDALTPVGPLNVLSQILLYCFVAITVLIILNLLIAQLSADYQPELYRQIYASSKVRSYIAYQRSITAIAPLNGVYFVCCALRFALDCFLRCSVCCRQTEQWLAQSRDASFTWLAQSHENEGFTWRPAAKSKIDYQALQSYICTMVMHEEKKAQEMKLALATKVDAVHRVQNEMRKKLDWLAATTQKVVEKEQAKDAADKRPTLEHRPPPAPP
jgi:hypothetical protein